MTKVLTYGAFADAHGMLPDATALPETDFLFIVGDFCPYTNHNLGFQYEWAKYTLAPWLHLVLMLGKARYVVSVAGNHDFIGTTPYGKIVLNELPWTYLQDETVTIEGIKIHGTPWTPQFFDWAFMDQDQQLMQYWDKIPSTGLDVLLSHGPPRGILDVLPRGERVGSESLAQRLTEIEPPQVSLYGHLHSNYGTHGGMYGVPLSANVSLVNEQYEPVHEVFTGELGVRSGG